MRSCHHALRIALVSSAALLAIPASADPLGGRVATGSASIANASTSTTVTQTSEGVVIDWSSFNVAKGQTTTFAQPNAQAIAVNRIGGSSASQIFGTLDANGRVVLINGNGILFGSGSQVDVGSLVATSSDASNTNVLAGKFTKAGSASAFVVNDGKISASQGGLVALVAPNVTNAGTIKATLGTVSLGAANAFTVDFKGDGLVSFATQGDVSGKASAINSGKLIGANISMTAHAAEGVATGVVNTSGVIEAEGVHNAGGTIVLDASNGMLTTSGTINAAGQTGGGYIETSGDKVAIAGTITAGRGGNWTVDPDNLTIDTAAALTIHRALQDDTNVEVQTMATGASGPGTINTSGVGDIDIEAGIGWSTGATFTIDAYHSINIDQWLNVDGAGTLSLQYNDEGTDGALAFGADSHVEFRGNGNLFINGVQYTLVDSISELASAIASDASGDYALANTYDAGGDGTYTSAPIQTAFTGNFEGLGNAISHLYIDDTNSDDNVGLFAINDGTIANLNIFQPKIEGAGAGENIGGLAGENNGDIQGDSVRSFYGAILARGGSQIVGGLVGNNENGATIEDSSASIRARCEGRIPSCGGLVGEDGGAIAGSDSSGAVEVTLAGGNDGGLVGYMYGGSSLATISNSYATGAVSGGTAGPYGGNGGLVGWVEPNSTISDSYATGAVSGGGYIGGLIGVNSGVVSGTYATGAVSSAAALNAGGLAGTNNGTIANSYSTGAVSDATAFYIGGLIGEDGGTIENSYYDIDNVEINGAHAVSFGGIYNAQYQDWLSHNLTLSISNYFGSPDSNGYYSIGSVQDLENMLGFAEDPSVKFKLTQNLDLSAEPGLFVPYLAGTLNGDGYVVSGLSLSESTENYEGFVGLLFGGALSNIGVAGESLSGNGAVGGTVGGLVGYNLGGTVTGAYATGTVSSTGAYADVGGLVGNNLGNISNSYSEDSVSDSGTVGGSVGGLVGLNNGTISGSYATGSVSSDVLGSPGVPASVGNPGVAVGGLVGLSNGSISNSFATGSVSDTDPSLHTITYNEVGGLVGLSNGSISNSYAMGAVNGSTKGSYVGGLIGLDLAAIHDSYATGDVSGGSGSYLGGLIGYLKGGTNSYLYWDTQTSGLPSSYGVGNIPNAPIVIGLTTAQFQSGLPSGFSATYWGESPSINDGFPYLLSNPPA